MMNKGKCAAVIAMALIMMPVFASCASAKRLYKWKQKVAPMIVPAYMASEENSEIDAKQMERQRKKARRGMDRIDKRLRRQYKTEHKLRRRRDELMVRYAPLTYYRRGYSPTTEDWFELNDIYQLPDLQEQETATMDKDNDRSKR